MNFETEIFKLPCGYKEPDGGFFYSHVEVREMTGIEEDLFTNRKKLQSGAAYNEVLSNCCTLIQSVDDEPTGQKIKVNPQIATEMRQGDRFACLIWLRLVSYGPTYKFQVKCQETSCAKTINFDIDLSQIERHEMAEPEIDFYDIILPRSEDTLTFKINTGKEERKMEKLLEQNPGDSATINLAARLVKVNGETVRPMPYLKGLTVKDRNFYRLEALKKEGYLENEVELTCPSCQSDFKTQLPIQSDFFLPTTD